MTASIGKLPYFLAFSLFIASACLTTAAAEPQDSFAHGGGFHHPGEWDGGFGPGFVGAFSDEGTRIEKPYRYGGEYGYDDYAPYGYDYGICRTYNRAPKFARQRGEMATFLSLPLATRRS